MTEKEQCRLCGQLLSSTLLTVKQLTSNDTYNIACSMCGRSTITWEANLEIEAEISKAERADLASWVREQAARGRKSPTICSSSHEGSDSSQDYRINQILETLIPRSISERLDRVLENLGAMAKQPGERCNLITEDYYLCWADSPRQMDFFLQALQDYGWIKGIGENWQQVLVTFKGWQRISELQAVGARGDQAFVAMWFAKSMEAAWNDGLYAGIKAAGYRPIRVDKQEHNEKICDRIVTEIRRSGLLVADVTGHRQGVYFEAGYAMGLGIPVVWTCRKSDLKKCHFDTRQYNHIVWETPEALAKALEYRIRATIGEPPTR